MRFFEVQPDVVINVDHIVAVEFKVATLNTRGEPFKYEIVTTLIDGTQYRTPMDHKANLEPIFNAMVSQLNT